MTPVTYHTKPYKLYSIVIINYDYACDKDLLLVYSNNQLRGKLNINIKYNKSIGKQKYGITILLINPINPSTNE